MWHVKQQVRGISTTPTDWAWRFDSEDAGAKREREEEERVMRPDEGGERKTERSPPRQAMEWPFRTTMVSTEFEPLMRERRGTLSGRDEKSELEAEGQRSCRQRPKLEKAKSTRMGERDDEDGRLTLTKTRSQ